MDFLHFTGLLFTFFLFAAWIVVVFNVIGDIFLSQDLNGWKKGLWILFVIVLPWIGVLSYFIFRGDGMHDRNVKAMEDAAEAERAYIKNAVGLSLADELTKLADLKEKGVITESEFNDQKAKLLK